MSQAWIVKKIGERVPEIGEAFLNNSGQIDFCRYVLMSEYTILFITPAPSREEMEEKYERWWRTQYVVERAWERRSFMACYDLLFGVQEQSQPERYLDDWF